AKGSDGRIYVALSNIDPNNPVSFELSLKGTSVTEVKGETLYASQMDAVNTFEDPDNVSPKEITAQINRTSVQVTVQPQSVTVLTLSP
ncbi:alpha-L-arabinofuranosidase C-terminal domain-containing protein, partial [Balneolaceae bacterium ANBcel3]|nr:alpha-L-arabinofuranosidase C-terminal domain-containing protein [Balneolaceae bacterium ANBcel3]